MRSIEYKGFLIEELSYDHFTYVSFEYNVPALGKSYKTENNAKGAITKHIKQQEIKEFGTIEFEEACAQAAREQDSFYNLTLPNQETIDSVSIPIPSGLSREETRQFIIAHAKQFIISHAERPQQSRNVREGYFSGLYNGSVKRLPLDTYSDGKKCVWSNNDEPKNRKQRKAAKMRQKHSVSAGQLWNDYMCVGIVQGETV